VSADVFIACRRVRPAAAAAAIRAAADTTARATSRHPAVVALVTPSEPRDAACEMCGLHLSAAATTTPAAAGDAEEEEEEGAYRKGEGGERGGEEQGLTFTFRRQRFRHLGAGAFAPPAYPDDKPFGWYLAHTGMGKRHQVDAAAEKWGANEFEIPMPTFGDLLREQLLAPFFVFQVFCCALW
jgi:hypothetical protein